MSAVESTLLENNSQVSTGRGCDFCGLVIKDTKWFTCSQCVTVDCCLDCYKNRKTMPLELKEKAQKCAKLSEEQQTHLPQCLPGSDEVTVGEHQLHLWAYHQRMSNDHYKLFTKNSREKIYHDIISRYQSKPTTFKFKQRDFTILTWKLGQLESDQREAKEVQDERMRIFALLGQIYLQAKRVRILTLDGGGTRGYLTIRVLEEAFKLLAAEFPDKLREIAEDPKLNLTPENIGGGYWCLRKPAYLAAQKYFTRHFDMIVGTSTGALIGFCLAVDIPLYEIRELYANASVFFIKNSNWISWLSEFPLRGPKYNATPIETKMLQILHQRFLSEDQPLAAAKDLRLSDIMDKFGVGPAGELRQLVINAFDMGHNKMINFNTKYKPHHHYGMFDILRGAMAGELYFSPHKPVVTTYSDKSENNHDDYLKKSLYVDAGIYANDPSLIALYIARLDPSRLPSTKYVLLGIGTGVHDSTFQSSDGIGGGGLLSWIKGQKKRPQIAGGLLPNTCMEATRSFTEIVASDLGRSPMLPRFKYNLRVKDAVALDDLTFKTKVDAEWKAVETSDDMKALRSFITNEITNTPPQPLTTATPPDHDQTTAHTLSLGNKRTSKRDQTEMKKRNTKSPVAKVAPTSSPYTELEEKYDSVHV